MSLKTQARPGSRVKDPRRVAVLVERLPGYDVAEVVARLRVAGAQAIKMLAPACVSAARERGRPRALADVAEISVKPPKRPLGAAR